MEKCDKASQTRLVSFRQLIQSSLLSISDPYRCLYYLTNCRFVFLFSEFAALDSTAKELGLGENIAIKLNRGSRVSGRQESYTIDTDKQLELEMPSILNGTDKLLSK